MDELARPESSADSSKRVVWHRLKRLRISERNFK